MLALALTAFVVAQIPDAMPQDDVGVQLVPRPSAAAVGISTERLRELMHTYVRGERMAAIPFAISGVSQALAGGLLLTSNNNVAHGAAWPLLVLGVVEIAASLVLGVRSQEPKLDALLAEGVPAFLTHERKHAHRITHLYQPALLAIEAVALATGGVLAGAGAARQDGTMAGVGFSLAIGALVIFVLDWAVLDRAQAYETALSVPPAGT
jgi:hypothetical protein